ncbi:MAG: GAF domain-containing protein [Cyanobacteria bacterium J06560_5]
MIVANHTSEFSQKERASQAADALAAQADIEKKALATQNSLIRITNQIRKSLDFEVICETATQEMLGLLQADRVAIYQFNPDWSGRFIFEAARPEWIPLVEAQQHNELISKNVSDCSVRLLDTQKTADTHLQATYGGSFVQGEIFRVCEDIENAGFSDCYIEVLKSYQARAYVIIAIYLDNQLWGLLAAYQNSGPRQWKESEVHILFQVAEQLGIALKQAEYVTTMNKLSLRLF